MIRSILAALFFIMAPDLSHADTLNLASMLKCASQVGILGANEATSCFGAAQESDGSLGLVEICGLGGTMSTRAFFSQTSEKKNGYAIAPDFVWTPCP